MESSNTYSFSFYNKTRNINSSEERAINDFYKDVKLCKRLPKEEVIKYLKRIRQIDYDIWDVIFGEAPVLLQYLVNVEIPTYVKEHINRFYYKAEFDDDKLKRLSSIVHGYRTNDHHWSNFKDRQDFREIKLYFARDLTIRLDGGRLLRDHLLEVLRGNTKLYKYRLALNVDSKKRIKRIETLLKKKKRLQDTVFGSTIRLAIKASVAYYSRFKDNLWFTYSDVLQYANIGLHQAIRRFDPERGFAFSTYATHWINQTINQAVLEKDNLISCPTLVILAYRKINKFTNTFVRQHHRLPTDTEIINGLKKDKQINKKVLQRCKSAPFYIRSLNEKLSFQNSKKRGKGRDVTVLEYLVGDFPDAEAVSEYRRIIETLEQNIEKIPQPERDFVKDYYIKGDHTLASLGEAHGVSLHKARQVLLRGLQDLRILLEKEGWEKNSALQTVQKVYDNTKELGSSVLRAIEVNEAS